MKQLAMMQRKPGRRLLTLAGVAIVAVALASCASSDTGAGSSPTGGTTSCLGPDEAALVAKAQGEGGLVVYSSNNSKLLDAHAAAMSKDCGITMTYVQASSSTLATRVNEEAKAGGIKTDVITTSDQGALDGWADQGLLAPLPKVDYPGIKEYRYPVSYTAYGVVYNTDLVKGEDVPETWEDVLDPRWKGQIVLGSPSISVGFAFSYLAIQQDPKYPDFVADLAKQKPTVVTDVNLVVQNVASGQAAFGYPGVVHSVVEFKKGAAANAPVAFKTLDVIPLDSVWSSMVKNAAHPASAEVYSRWLMSPAGQEVHAGDGQFVSPLGEKAVPGSMPYPDKTLISPYTSLQVTPDLYKAFIEKFNNLTN